MHFVSGCGHYLQLPGGQVIGIGVGRPDCTPAMTAADSSLTGEQPERGKVLGAGDCLICGFVALAKHASGTAPCGATTVAARMWSLSSDHPTLVFQRLISARAPPIA